jgi:hypothetical protein
VAAVLGKDVGFGSVPSWRLVIAGTMIVYALVIYPLLGMLSGHTYPSAPIFGVAL